MCELPFREASELKRGRPGAERRRVFYMITQFAEVPLAFHSGTFTEMGSARPGSGLVLATMRAGRLPGNGFLVEHEFNWGTMTGAVVFNDNGITSDLKFRIDRACYAIMKTRWAWWQDPAYSTSVPHWSWRLTSENDVPDLLGTSNLKAQCSVSDTVYNTTGMVAYGPRKDQTELILEPDYYNAVCTINGNATFLAQINRSGGFVGLRLELYEIPGNTAGQYPDGEESRERDAPAEQAADPYFLIEGVRR